MGEQGKKIVALDIAQLLNLLNKALADEWLAYYQYWIGAQVVEGRLGSIVQKELEEHAEEELKHAKMLVKRIIELGGSPVNHPKQWIEIANCRYDAPNDVSVEAILKQNISGERCAIAVYQKLLDFTHTKDPITYDMALEILKEEVEHEEDLENLLIP
ncbi:MAG: ferritin-like domain-containing protein [Parachlamydiales bacterium]|nr:ferritin-like domain-containing protein [Parachlamydiales bacterium]